MAEGEVRVGKGKNRHGAIVAGRTMALIVHDLLPTMLERRPRVPAPCEDLVQSIAADTAQRDSEATFHEIARLVGENRRIHDLHGINLNPASNVMNPRAEAMMAAGLGSRASLGYPGDKYEMGLEAIERIEVICAELAAEVFGANTPRCASPPARWPTSLRLHGHLQTRRHHHRAAGRHRRPRHPPRRGRGPACTA